MTFDSTVTLGNLLTILTLALGLLAAIISSRVEQAKAGARIDALEKGKVATVDCLRSHGETVTTGFCRQQHERSNSVIERLSEEFGGLGLQVRELVTNQHWVMDSLKLMNAHGVKTANPRPAELPPDPRDRPQDGWDPKEAE